MLSGIRVAVIALIGFSVFGTSSCGLFEKDKKKQKVRRVFVHGDPADLYKGADADKTSFFTVDNYKEFNDFDFTGGAVFYDREELVEQEEMDIEEGQEATSEDTSDEISHYQFVTDGSVFQYRDVDQKSITLEFERQGDRLNISKIKLGRDALDLEPIHYSVNDKKDTWSILASGRDGTGEFIIALYYTRNEKNITLLDDVEDRFNYLLGPGVRARWPGEIKTDLCGEMPELYLPIVEKGIEAWDEEDLAVAPDKKIGDAPYSFQVVDKYKPFSDVNQNCVQVVDDFFFEDSEEYVVGGLTLPVISKTTREIKASHVFISRAGIKKFGVPEDRGRIYRIAAHEYGHYLGLDHEFEKDEFGSGYKYPSIMGYDSDVRELTDHDREAIKALYTN